MLLIIESGFVYCIAMVSSIMLWCGPITCTDTGGVSQWTYMQIITIALFLVNKNSFYIMAPMLSDITVRISYPSLLFCLHSPLPLRCKSTY